MDERELLAERFEEHRRHLRVVAYRLLGSLSEADDAVQEAWVRLDRSDADEIDNLGGWLSTVVARVCLNVLRSRRTRREDELDPHTPDLLVARPGGGDPEQEALLADAVGLALLVVLDALSPAERVAFVLHDMFAVPFEEIAPMLDRSPAATRQLASRARRRVRSSAPTPDRDLARQNEVSEAFSAAARDGDFSRLLSVLHPDAVLRVDFGRGAPPRETRGADAIARSAIMFATADSDDVVRSALVNGAAGQIRFRDGKPFSLLGFTIVDGRVAAIDIVADPGRLAGLDVALLEE